jgi:5'-3' exoribonuclease 2
MIEKHGKVGWTLSSSDEPGEGEHKIMAEWRKGVYKGDFAVYGLDADLIVLSMLGQACNSLQNKIWLFREDVTPNDVGNAKKEEIFEWFSIDLLREWITSSCMTDDKKHKFILNYCFAMSILGNDFLPSSLGLKMRDDGHSELLYILQTMMTQQTYLVDSTTLTISFQGIRTLFTLLTTSEDIRITGYISKKQMFARQLGAHSGKVGDNNWPLFHIEEEVLIDKSLRKTTLYPHWKELYLTRFFKGYHYDINTIQMICKEYLHGIQWIWAYYTGGDVCYNWYYPHSLPPLWEWIRDYLHKVNTMPLLSPVALRAADIRPVEQLSIVLPLESWSLIPPCLERTLPKVAPHFFPTSFSFESVGKRFFWECESLIPLPTIMELKRLMRIR